MSFWSRLLSTATVVAALLVARASVDPLRAADRAELPGDQDDQDDQDGDDGDGHLAGAQNDTGVVLPAIAVAPVTSALSAAGSVSDHRPAAHGRLFVSDIFRPPIGSLA